jgi:hypothetical protein
MSDDQERRPRRENFFDAEFTVIRPTRHRFNIKWGGLHWGWNWEGAIRGGLISGAIALPALLNVLPHHQ